jgi:hypothetical protein
MFRLNWKDNLFLVGITFLMIFVALVFSATWKEVGVQNNYETNVTGDTKVQSGVFDCGGDSFSVNQSVSNFTFRNIQHETNYHIEKDCRWRSLSNEYDILYWKILDEYQVDLELMKKNFNLGVPVDQNNPKYFLKTPDGFEGVYKGPENNMYMAIKIMFIKNSMYFLGFASLEEIDLTNPSFRSFVDSFELVK